MELTKHLPTSLRGPRTYFSLLDKSNVQHANDWKRYKQELDNVLKVLLLTKETIVIAGSALCSEESYDYFSEYNKHLLFEKGIIKPAIRSNFSNFSEVFEDRIINKKAKLPQQVDNFFSKIITEIVPWNLKENSNWYKSEVAKQVYDEKSLLRNCLRTLDANSEKEFVDIFTKEVEGSAHSNYFDRDKVVITLKNNFKGDAYIAISQFLDLLYYISGSQVVKCENYVPQENLLYYSHATMNFGQKMLSDASVFQNIVTQIILSEIYDHTFPVDIIYNMSFEDIISLREKNKDKSKEFREKYDECLISAQKIREYDDKEALLYNFNDLVTLSDEIRKQFSASISHEISSFKSCTRISKGVDYVFELMTNLIGLVNLRVSIISLIFNDTKLKETNLINKIRTKVTNQKEHHIRSYIKRKYKNDPILLTFFDDIIKKHKENYLNVKL